MTIPFVEEAEASPKEGECESQFFNTVCLAGPSGEVVSQLTETWTGKNWHHVLRFFPACSGARTVRSSTIAKRTCGTLLRLFSKSVSRSGDEWIRNLHFWEDYVDGSWASRGDSPGFVETEFGRVGIGTMALMKRVPSANLRSIVVEFVFQCIESMQDSTSGLGRPRIIKHTHRHTLQASSSSLSLSPSPSPF